MPRYLFDKKITPACKYCYFASNEDGSIRCDKKGRVSAEDKCMRFRYDPTLREPELAPLPGRHSAEEFKI